MKSAFLATTGIAAAIWLISNSLAASVKAQNCIVGGAEISVCLPNNEETNNRRSRTTSDYEKLNNIYQEVLGRDADFQEMRTWERELTRGRSLGDIRHQISHTREAENAVIQIHWDVLGRNVDKETLKYWTRRLARGRSLVELRLEMERRREEAARRQLRNRSQSPQSNF